MNIIEQDREDDQPFSLSGFGFYPRMEELADLLLKREVLRMLYRELKPQEENINICLHLRGIERAAAVLDWRITIASNCLIMGVLR